MLVLTGEACTNISRARGMGAGEGRASTEGKGLHEGESAMRWPTFNALKKLCKGIGMNKMVSVHEQVVSNDTLVEKSLNLTYGTPLVAEASDWGCAHRKRHLRLYPRLGGGGEVSLCVGLGVG